MIGLTVDAGDNFKKRASIPLAPCTYIGPYNSSLSFIFLVLSCNECKHLSISVLHKTVQSDVVFHSHFKKQSLSKLSIFYFLTTFFEMPNYFFSKCQMGRSPICKVKKDPPLFFLRGQIVQCGSFLPLSLVLVPNM